MNILKKNNLFNSRAISFSILVFILASGLLSVHAQSIFQGPAGSSPNSNPRVEKFASPNVECVVGEFLTYTASGFECTSDRVSTTSIDILKEIVTGSEESGTSGEGLSETALCNEERYLKGFAGKSIECESLLIRDFPGICEDGKVVAGITEDGSGEKEYVCKSISDLSEDTNLILDRLLGNCPDGSSLVFADNTLKCKNLQGETESIIEELRGITSTSSVGEIKRKYCLFYERSVDDILLGGVDRNTMFAIGFRDNKYARGTENVVDDLSPTRLSVSAHYITGAKIYETGGRKNNTHINSSTADSPQGLEDGTMVFPGRAKNGGYLKVGSRNWSDIRSFNLWVKWHDIENTNWNRVFDFGIGPREDNIAFRIIGYNRNSSREYIERYSSKFVGTEVWKGALKVTGVNDALDAYRQWVHYVVNFVREDGEWRRDTYVNGVKRLSEETAIPTNRTLKSNYIALSNWQWEDDVEDNVGAVSTRQMLFLNRALSEDEIKALYNAGAGIEIYKDSDLKSELCRN